VAGLGLQPRDRDRGHGRRVDHRRHAPRCRDATTLPQQAGYTPDVTRNVDFLESYPPGNVALGELWGPMREETSSWLSRLALGHSTPHATAAEAHNRLMLTKALDLSARRRRPVTLPITPEDERA
jgi:hypothetical protein